MPVTYLDQEVERLLRERKPVPADWNSRVRLRPRRRHHERDLTLRGDTGSEFLLIFRQNKVNQLDFSIILAVRVPRSNHLFRIRRYNGKSHEHTNRIEQVTFYDFHIHIATQRYQDLGTREDAFAEPTDRYADFHGALRCLISDSNLEVPQDTQGEFAFGSD